MIRFLSLKGAGARRTAWGRERTEAGRTGHEATEVIPEKGESPELGLEQWR